MKAAFDRAAHPTCAVQMHAGDLHLYLERIAHLAGRCELGAAAIECEVARQTEPVPEILAIKAFASEMQATVDQLRGLVSMPAYRAASL